VAAQALVAALLETIGVALLAAGALVAAGYAFQWGAWTGAAAMAGSGAVLILGSAWLAWRASRGPSFCITCGRPLPPAAGWKGGPRMCDQCVRKEVSRLKTPQQTRAETAALQASLASPQDDLASLDLNGPEEESPFAPPPPNGDAEKRFQL
jgi:hypothetical protein